MSNNTQVILSPFFVGDNGFAQHDSSKRKPGHYTYSLVSAWCESVLACRMTGVLVHDQLSDEFVAQHTTDSISFYKYTEQHRLSHNDNRFWAYRHWLGENPHITHAICTDAFDVEFAWNPFTLFADNPAALFVGSEKRTNRNARWVRDKIRACGYSHKLKGTDRIYNAGIVGGSRETLNTFLDLFIAAMRQAPKDVNANMAALQVVVGRVINAPVLTGSPLHTVFKQHKHNGAAIKHK